jgi:histidine triad (HIT) family protein
MSCVFCEIVSGRVSAQKAYEDTHVVAIHDIHPQAPVHVLIIPKIHRASLNEFDEMDSNQAGELLMSIPRVARALNISGAYKTVINTGAEAGQTVFHLHVHILGGGKVSGLV